MAGRGAKDREMERDGEMEKDGEIEREWKWLRGRREAPGLLLWWLITWQSGGTPRGGVWHIALLGGRDHQQVAEAIAEPQEDVAVAERYLRGNRGVVGEHLHGDTGERLVGAGVTQMHL